MAPAFSFKKALNTITPQKGMVVAVYVSDRKMGSGVKSFLMLAVTGRYVTLFHIPLLQCLRVKRAEWPGYSAKELNVSAIQLFTDLTVAMKLHALRGRKWSHSATTRALAIIEDQLP